MLAEELEQFLLALGNLRTKAIGQHALRSI
jgi:hypothetical protein